MPALGECKKGRLMKQAGAVLDPLLKNLGLESGVRLVRIRQDWHRLFDEAITAHLYPVSFSDNQLLLHVTSPIWMQQFSFHKSDIVRKLSPYGVREVRFRLGRVPQRDQEIPPCRNARELTRENSAFLMEILSQINDEALKDTIRKAAEKSLLSKKPLHAD